MPPHCDSLSGPVVMMAKRAPEAGNINLILPYVPKESEGEVTAAFNKVLPLHRQPNGAHEIVDMYFFETVVRLHRAGEGAPYTGPKYTSPLQTALIFVSFVIVVGFFGVALLINRSLEMFASPLGTWIPFALIFTSTYATGLFVTNRYKLTTDY